MMSKQIKRVDPSQPGAWGLLIRHGERDAVAPGSLGMDAQLTEHGKEASRRLGASLAHLALHTVVTSPIERCVETGSCLCAGYGSTPATTGALLQQDLQLAAAYVRDPQAARKTFASAAPEEVVLRQLAGEAMGGLHSLAQGSQLLLALLLSYMAPRTLTVFVSHDAIVMPFQSYFLKRRFSATAWLGYLEGSILYADAGTVQVDGVAVKQGTSE